jgi:hypothetical protein
MPYLRLHLPEVSIEQKRVIAHELIDITLRSFRLRRADRYQISIEFVSQPHSHAWPSSRRGANFTMEVLGHNLTEAQKRTFSEAATAMLEHVLPQKAQRRIARLFGIHVEPLRKVDFHFGELSPAISEPFVMHAGSTAA